MLRKTIHYGRMIKFQHSIFALPFALASFVLASRTYGFSWYTLAFIVIAMVSARSAAMGFNRIADVKFDIMNSRTNHREIPRSIITKRDAWIFVAISSLIFIYSAYSLNLLCFLLAPVVLFILFFYSYTKRFTTCTHLFLGVSLGLAPVGAWIAVSGQISFLPFLLGFFVVLWVAGFDIIYACQDVDFDRKVRLFSIPAVYGTNLALKLSTLAHLVAIIPLVILGTLAHLGIAYFLGIFIVSCLLLWEHQIISHTRLTRLNTAFFTINAWTGVVFFVFLLADVAIVG
jgi:4-hydroxybenzoate polyprenyltransferase